MTGFREAGCDGVCDRLSTSWPVFEVDRKQLWKMVLWHLGWVREQRVARTFSLLAGFHLQLKPAPDTCMREPQNASHRARRGNGEVHEV